MKWHKQTKQKAMKKNIIIAAVLFVICFRSANAQEGVTTTASVARNFEKEFSGASNVQWTKKDKIFVATFKYEGGMWIGYFNESGEKLASGRKIKSLDQLPLQVQKSLDLIKEGQERKFGTIETSYAMEIVADGNTKYYVPMANASISLMVEADNSGGATIRKSTKHAAGKPSKNLIAKKD